MNRETFNDEFEKIKSPLKSFILRMLASTGDTEDLLHDTYVKAAQNLESYREESTLKTWVFAIASNLARDFLRARKRWPENVTDICRESALSDPEFMNESMNIRMTSPQGNFEIREHIAFCFTCISKSLPLEQQVCILLREVYDFRLGEIAEIIANTESMVKYYLGRARMKMIEIFEGRCALINKEGICHQCTELNGIYNPQQKTQEELMKIEMVRKAGSAGREKLFELRAEIIRSIDPFSSGAAELELHHLEYNRKVMEKYPENPGTS